MLRFSVLISVYINTTRDDLVLSLTSLITQIRLADEIIIVEDGPLQAEVTATLEEYSSKLPIVRVQNPKNRGLGLALRDGITHCTHELVARVDSDDRCLPNRFLIQTEFMSRRDDISVLGGAMRENFKVGRKTRSALRPGYSTEKLEKTVLLYRNPLNHPTVMFRKSAVLAVGNYEHCPFFEDFFLWQKIISAGHKIANISDILVETDVNLDYFRRRGGPKYAKYEIDLCKKLRQKGYFSAFNSIVFLMMRLPFRIMPGPIRQLLYFYFLRKQTSC